MKISTAKISRNVKMRNKLLEKQGCQQELLVCVRRVGSLEILSFYRQSLLNNANNSNMKTRLSLDMTLAQGMEWLETFDPSKNGFQSPQEQPPLFPNGFDAWQETHFEMVCRVQAAALRRGSLSYLRHETDGTGSLYQLAKEMTDGFEAEYAGRLWTEIFSMPSKLFVNLKKDNHEI